MVNHDVRIKALASPQRLMILQLLSEPGRNFSEQWSADPVEFGVCMTLIAKALELSQPTVSRHVDLLRQAGFITTRRYQKWSYCKRNEPVLADYHKWLGKELVIQES